MWLCVLGGGGADSCRALLAADSDAGGRQLREGRGCHAR